MAQEERYRARWQVLGAFAKDTSLPVNAVSLSLR